LKEPISFSSRWAAHKSVVVGLVGLTAVGSYSIGSGLWELRGRRLAAAAPPDAATNSNLK